MTKLFKRSDGDCMRMSVHLITGISYGDIPHETGEPAANNIWTPWAATHGLRWWANFELAPVSLPRWIAIVDGLNHAESLHAVAMEGHHLLADPNEDDPNANVYAAVGPEDVRGAYALIPADQPSVSPPFWRITNPARKD